jgi:hypothetical protein
MDADPDARREAVVAAVIAQRALDRAGALKRAVGLGKRDEEAVALVLDLLPRAHLNAPP